MKKVPNKIAATTITTANLRTLKADGMIKLSELAKRARMKPHNLLAYTYNYGDQRLERPRHAGKSERLRNALREHAIRILQMTGDLPVPKIPDTLPHIPESLAGEVE